ncbi:MAG: VIT1/CCC1 transporter family protein [Candidatus Aenigmatarchaeota archaeon]
MGKIDAKTMGKILSFQKNEITEHIIYSRLSRSAKDPENKKLLEGISRDELAHYNFWKGITGMEAKPSKMKIWKYLLIAKIFGLTFGMKLMEGGEEGAQEAYGKISKSVPKAIKILRDEDRHEQELLGMISEERLKYVGSIVLGLNDALVELTGTLAGLTFAFQNTQIISLAGLITGIAASFSMGASEYLSTKSEETAELRSPKKASAYTTIAYILTVLFLISPFFLLSNHFLALALTIVNALIVIFIFTFYISVARSLPFRRRFAEMAAISLGIASITFLIGMLIRVFLGIEV